MFYLLNTAMSLVIIFWKNIQVFFHLGIFIDLPINKCCKKQKLQMILVLPFPLETVHIIRRFKI